MRLIDADYLAKQLREQRVKPTGKLTEGINKGLNTAISIARNPDACPTIEAKPVVHGEIIETIEKGKMKRVFSCCNTVCTQLTMWLEPNFCPNCGADMRERKET